MNSNFNENEIVKIERWDKKENKKVIKFHPVVGGRLRLFHEDISNPDFNNPDIKHGIETEIIESSSEIAIVKATVSIYNNVYSGTGMASKKRDPLIHPAIAELAETRAIARALRFAGYGVEYTGAEEMSHIDNANKGFPKNDKIPKQEKPEKQENKRPAAEDGRSLKRSVWDILKKEFNGHDEKSLGMAMNLLLVETIKENPEMTESDFLSICLEDNKSLFRAISLKIEGPEESESVKAKEAYKEYQEEKKKVADSMKPEVNLNPVNHQATERKKKAKLFMSLPDGSNSKQFESFIKILSDNNKDESMEDIYDACLSDTSKFVEQFIIFSEVNNEEEESAETTDEENEYSEHQKKWVNLRWESFCLFIRDSENIKEMKKNREEYDAAVLKFNRLKKNNDPEAVFPWEFDVGENEGKSLDPQKSIFDNKAEEKNRPEDGADPESMASRVSLCCENYPKMSQEVSDYVGGFPSDSQGAEIWIEEFDHRLKTYKLKNKKEYKE